MAKKVKTPEELQASMERKTKRRKLFFGTFTKSLAIFLAIAMAYSLAVIAFTPATVASVPAQNNGGTSTDNSNGDDDLGDVFGDDNNGGSSTDNNGGTSTDNNGGTSTDNNGGTSTDSNSGTSTDNNKGNTSTDNNGGAPAQASKADIAKAINDATAVAAKAGYDWSRKCYFTQPLQVLTSSGKNAADTLNGIIQKVDENANIDSVVGNFLDVTGKESDPPKTAKKAKGTEVPEDMKKDKFLLQPMKLTENDIKNSKVEGNKYTVQLQNCANPQKGSDNNALNHATKDFITYDEVVTGVKDALGSLSSLLSVESADVNYTSILVTAEIADGKLTSLSYTYIMDVKALNLKAAVVSMTGKGKGKVEASYTNFVY